MGVIRNLSEFLIAENTKVLGCAPQFPRLVSEVELKKGIYDYCELKKENNYKFIIEDFLNKINENYNLIVIDNPNNPTGQIIKLEDIRRIVEASRKHNIMVIIDEAYGDYMEFENSAINLVLDYENIIVIRSASKLYGLPNHRIGYMFSNPKIIKIYNEVSIPFPFSDISAKIFCNVIDNYIFFENSKQKVKFAKAELLKSINSNNVLHTDYNTPILTIKTNKNIDLYKELRNQNIISESCIQYFCLDKHFVRIRINENIEEIARKINEII